jgi:hypothetical protein
MATQPKTQPVTDQFEKATERLQAFNDKAADASKKVSLSYVDSYERAGLGFADFQQKVADATPIEWVASLTNAQAGLTREITQAYASTARELLK